MKWIIKALFVVTYLILATWAVAGDPQAKLTQVAENHENYAERAPGNLETAARIPELTTMVAEIRAVMDSTRRAERVLIEEFGPALNPELTRRMGELKKSSRMRGEKAGRSWSDAS